LKMRDWLLQEILLGVEPCTPKLNERLVE
jgi:hypothetical protein